VVLLLPTHRIFVELIASLTDISARFCAAPTPTLICCLPCPISDWVFSDKFAHQASSANYVGILTLILNSMLLLTYVVLPEEKSHRHYLSIGLTLSLILLSIAFIIPLGTKPDECFNEITPDNMHTDMSCAWTGALFSLGFMGAVVWSESSFHPSVSCALEAKLTEIAPQSSSALSGQPSASSSTSSAPSSSNGSASPSASAYPSSSSSSSCPSRGSPTASTTSASPTAKRPSTPGSSGCSSSPPLAPSSSSSPSSTASGNSPSAL